MYGKAQSLLSRGVLVQTTSLHFKIIYFSIYYIYYPENFQVSLFELQVTRKIKIKIPCAKINNL